LGVFATELDKEWCWK